MNAVAPGTPQELQACEDNFVDVVVCGDINVWRTVSARRLSHERAGRSPASLAALHPGDYDPLTISRREGPPVGEEEYPL